MWQSKKRFRCSSLVFERGAQPLPAPGRRQVERSYIHYRGRCTADA
jgi:hypothetical protein